MRADRLLSLLILLQLRGRTTAGELARELEVSERTIYRDLQALSTAGVPVYAERGPGGGCELLDTYRTNLTGLNEAELQALFMLNIPAPLDDLGVSQLLRSAFLKLAAALPTSSQDAEIRTRERIHIDPAYHNQFDEPAPHLRVLYQAVWEDRELEMTVRYWHGGENTLMIEPLGLVARGSEWHLVYSFQENLRAIRVADIQEVRLLNSNFVRPSPFNLSGFWSAYSSQQEGDRLYQVVLRFAPEVEWWLKRDFGMAFKQALDKTSAPDSSGWHTIQMEFDSLETARSRLLAFGGAVEVLEPRALCLGLADYAQQITHRYQIDPANSVD